MNVRTVEMPKTDVLAATRLPAILTILGGIALLFLVGFVQVPAVHNGAHDTRHSNGFPCH
jgi:cobalt transporter subunit CbtB